eukprot:g71522.t1
MSDCSSSMKLVLNPHFLRNKGALLANLKKRKAGSEPNKPLKARCFKCGSLTHELNDCPMSKPSFSDDLWEL